MSDHASVCPLDCPDTCSLTVTVENAKIVKIRGSRANPYTAGVICTKVAGSYPDWVHGPGRIQTPLRRVGAKGEGRFEPREVKIGAQAGDEFEVLEGLAAGDRVVTSAQFLINSESNLQSAARKMMSASEPAEKPVEGHEAMEGEEMAPPPAAEEAPAPAHSGHGPE